MQKANEIHCPSVVEIQNVPVSDAVSSQQSDVTYVAESNENKEQISNVIINQEEAVTPHNEIVAPPVSEPKPSIAPKASECKKGTF